LRAEEVGKRSFLSYLKAALTIPAHKMAKAGEREQVFS